MKNFSTTILTHPLIQEGQLSVTGERMGTTVLVNWLGGLLRNSVASRAGMGRDFVPGYPGSCYLWVPV